ncbi:hypothetical protein GA0061083_1520 [Pseudarthrobacter enclensis]|uniref:hypothetical protein n=1 Tax=Pseudarthrobacter enclensis TaxID=993070 RepID=UPI000815CE5F|nr:hypothetical protein [Pseudarthrobacter enclensis]SCB91805.1 hypothetical protein GA0061083_1520 [Pseudarthrobacter enclensis]
MMFLLDSLTLLLDGRRSGSGSSPDSAAGAFPAGRLTSEAWEGWWHEDAGHAGSR